MDGKMREHSISFYGRYRSQIVIHPFKHLRKDPNIKR